jgi:hypothetical protein
MLLCQESSYHLVFSSSRALVLPGHWHTLVTPWSHLGHSLVTPLCLVTPWSHPGHILVTPVCLQGCGRAVPVLP